MDAIYFHELSREARAGIEIFLRAHDRDDLVERAYWDFNEVCGLWFQLRAVVDLPTIFPKGKWATLQRLQEIIEAEVAAERRREGGRNV